MRPPIYDPYRKARYRLMAHKPVPRHSIGESLLAAAAGGLFAFAITYLAAAAIGLGR